MKTHPFRLFSSGLVELVFFVTIAKARLLYSAYILASLAQAKATIFGPSEVRVLPMRRRKRAVGQT